MYAAFIMFALAVLFEKVKAIRTSLGNVCPAARTPVPTEEPTEENEIRGRRYRLSAKGRIHFIETLLYMVQFSVGYVLMLTVMTYNAWLFIAIILGAGIGHLLFGAPSSSASSDSHCGA
jgi:copper transporter 1